MFRRFNVNYKKYFAGAFAFALALSAVSCGDSKKDSQFSAPQGSGSAEAETSQDDAPEPVTAEETTEEELPPPEPTECDDPNAVTFDDGDFSFALAKTTDPDSAVGELSVEEVMGNKMLRFTDDNTAPLDTKVQKITINAAQLLGVENLPKVRSIEFDMYAQATADHLSTEDADNVRAPGWIGGGGGTVTAKVGSDGEGQWYDFQSFEGGEYNFETSGAVHVKYKFLLADSGLCWDETMEDANFLIMRWGLANESDMMIDNIVFYDADGNSIPLASAAETTEAAE